MIKEFMYTSNSGTKLRSVFVIREGQSYIEGIDLNLLPKADGEKIKSTYKDFTPIKSNDRSIKVQLEGFDPNWNKAYRMFSKSKIS